jgi:hypothetical protein
MNYAVISNKMNLLLRYFFIPFLKIKQYCQLYFIEERRGGEERWALTPWRGQSLFLKGKT